jgi:hypothetical protein
VATAWIELGKFKPLAQPTLKETEAAKSAAAFLNLARLSSALAELRHLIVDDAKAATTQAHFPQDAWLFGSEYSKLLDRRPWTRD